jgi:hypothetical protein
MDWKYFLTEIAPASPAESLLKVGRGDQPGCDYIGFRFESDGFAV